MIATTLVLMAVFVPVSFMTGDTGRLFGEFGVTVAAAVGFSAFVALSLTPMMASKLFANGMPKSRMAGGIDRMFHNLDDRYAAALRRALDGRKPLWIVGSALALFGVLVMLFVVGLPFSGLRIASELAPQEDRAMIRIFVTAPEGSSIGYLDRQLRQVEEIAMAEVENGNARRVNVRTGGFGRSGDVSTGIVFMPLNLWDQRDESAGAIADRLRQQTQGIAGARVNVNQVGSPLTRNSTRPLAIAMGGGDYAEIVQWRDKVMQRVAAENPRILNLESDYLERQPRVIVQIDRNKAADLGVSLQTVGRTLETMMGSRIVTTFERAGEEYDVMLQARETQRASVGDLDNLYVRSDKNDDLIPLSALVRVEERAGPTELRRTDRMRAIELAGSLAPGYTLGEAVAYMEQRDPRGSARGADHLQRRDLPVQEIRRRPVDHFRVRAAGGVPGAGGAVRELHPPRRHPRDRAAGAHRRVAGAVPVQLHHQHLQPDRLHHADRHRLQERHPDRRVRQPAA